MHQYIVRYTGEMGTKDKSTRWNLIQLLERNIRKGVQIYYGKEISRQTKIEAKWDQTIVYCQCDCKEILSHTAGISNFKEVIEHQYHDLDQMAKTAAEFFLPMMNGKRFAVRCRREKGKYPIKSREVEIAIGSLLYESGKVDLTNPEILCFVQVDSKNYYLGGEDIKGVGGYPVGSQGKALTLISGGFDSPVATYLMYKNGIDQDLVYFDLGGDVQRDCILATSKHLKSKWGFGSKGLLNMINFLPVMDIILKAPMPFQNMILKYCFYTVSTKIAQQLSISVLVTGESIGQVSTQTLKNLSVLDQQTPLLILRPVATMEKKEIIDIARLIDTHDLAYKGKELCAIAGKGVVTGTSLRKFAKALYTVKEELDQVLEEVTSQREIFDPMQWEGPRQRIKEVPEGYQVIDLRSENEFKIHHVKEAQNIPFAKAMTDFYHWDSTAKYFLICNVGSQSAILANAMQEEGFEVQHMSGGMEQID